MKIFYLSFGIFITIVITVFANAQYVAGTCEETITTLESMEGADDPQTPEHLSALTVQWNRIKKPLSLSVVYQTISKMEELILSLGTYHATEATVEFEQAKATLIHELNGIRQREKLSFFNFL